MSNLIICCCISSLEERVRLYKLKGLLDENFIKYQFLGWNRSGKNPSLLDYNVSYLMKFKKPVSFLMPFYYIMWSFLLFFKLIITNRSNNRVYAVGLESAFPVMIACFLKGGDYIFDNPDNFTGSFGLTGKVKTIIDRLEGYVASKSVAHILPSESRVIIPTVNDIFIYNTPSKSSVTKANSIYVSESNEFVNSIKKEERFKLYINGRIVDDRGADYLPTVFNELSYKEYCLVIVGEIDSKSLYDFLSKTDLKVYRANRVPNEVSLALYLAVDLVFALYSPIRPINKLAESNKWYDCLTIGTHCVTNKEISNVSKFSNYKNFSIVEYGNALELIRLLKRLRLEEKNTNQLSTFDWDMSMLSVLNK